MIRIASLTIAGLALLTITLPAQSPASFEAADVHPSPSRLHPEIHGRSRHDPFTLRDATLANLIADSYKVDPADVSGGPA